MPQYRTPRGFAMYADFTTPDPKTNNKDHRDFTVQESSAAYPAMVWVGYGDARAHLTVEEATQVRDALTEFIDDNG